MRASSPLASAAGAASVSAVFGTILQPESARAEARHRAVNIKDFIAVDP